jgi:hypothetical protein
VEKEHLEECVNSDQVEAKGSMAKTVNPDRMGNVRTKVRRAAGGKWENTR